jgi:hypothetical protein
MWPNKDEWLEPFTPAFETLAGLELIFRNRARFNANDKEYAKNYNDCAEQQSD